jgi:hypothetical protein
VVEFARRQAPRLGQHRHCGKAESVNSFARAALANEDLSISTMSPEELRLHHHQLGQFEPCRYGDRRAGQASGWGRMACPVEVGKHLLAPFAVRYQEKKDDSDCFVPKFRSAVQGASMIAGAPMLTIVDNESGHPSERATKPSFVLPRKRGRNTISESMEDR